MTRWEYHWVRVPLYDDGQYDLDTLDELGADGWEAYARSPTRDDHMIVHLKRPVPKEERVAMITKKQLETLADVFSNTEALEKITVALDPVSRSILVRYEDLDDEWFRELTEASVKESNADG